MEIKSKMSIYYGILNKTADLSGVDTNKTDIATNKTDIATNKTNIATNKQKTKYNTNKVADLGNRFPTTYKFYLPNLSTSLQAPKLVEGGFPPDIIDLKGKSHIFLNHCRLDDDGGTPSGSNYIVSIRLTIYYSTGTNSQHYLINKSLDSYAVGGSHQGNKKIFLLNEVVDIKSIDSSSENRITEYGIIEMKHSDSSKDGNEMYLVMVVA